MRARDRDAPAGAGGEQGVERSLVGIGNAEADATEAQRDKAARMLRRFAQLPEGTFVWTRGERFYFLGRIAGPLRYDDSPAAHETGIHQVRKTLWLERPFDEVEIPTAVAATFARGGRNFQRIHGDAVEQETAELWRRHGSA